MDIEKINSAADFKSFKTSILFFKKFEIRIMKLSVQSPHTADRKLYNYFFSNKTIVQS